MKRRNLKDNSITMDLVIDAVNRSSGNITGAAKRLKCERGRIYKMIEEHPILKEVIARARETIVDQAEESLLKNIKGGNVTSIIFVLKTLGRSRGYVLNGYKQNELASRISQAVLKKLTDEQLAELEKLLKKKKNLSAFLEEIGVDAASG